MTTKDPFFPNSPIRCQEGSIAVSLRHSQSTVSDFPTPSGKSSICKIESVAGKYKILSASSFILDHSTQCTNKSGYSQDHVGLLLAFNGRNDINYDAKHYYSFKGVSDKRPPFTNRKINFKYRYDHSEYIISFLENCESLVNLSAVTGDIPHYFPPKNLRNSVHS